MMNDATALSYVLATFAATYLVHSTILLLACWMLLRLTRANSHFLVERMWKLAAVMGLITTLMHMTIGLSLTFSLVENQIASPDEIAGGVLEVSVNPSGDRSGSIENVGGAENAIGADPVATFDMASESIDSVVGDLDQSFDVVHSGQPHDEKREIEFGSPTTRLSQESRLAEQDGDFQSEYLAESTSTALNRRVAASQVPRASFRRILGWVSMFLRFC